MSDSTRALDHLEQRLQVLIQMKDINLQRQVFETFRQVCLMAGAFKRLEPYQRIFSEPAL
ncbi:MAG: hypothetical protein ICV77_16340 [Cyanobacteria bacterium Co-bin8]|nr:hypothetical protein [Cyanobacteria bacterium Co-bin8]